MNFVRIAMRVAFNARMDGDHLKTSEIRKLLGSDPELTDDFLFALMKHDDFMEILYGMAGDRLSDGDMRKLKFLHRSLANDLSSLMGRMAERFPVANFSLFKQEVHRIVGEEILNPNVMIREMNEWAYQWHDVFSHMAREASKLLAAEANS
jgi:hypothetical protein